LFYRQEGEQFMNKNTWIIGFTLFAMFFGAVNLIFPPNLGLDSGQYFLPAILAFALTGFGLPLLGVVVGALDKQGYIGYLNNMSLQPFIVISRTASTSSELTITPITHTNRALILLIYTDIK